MPAVRGIAREVAELARCGVLVIFGEQCAVRYTLSCAGRPADSLNSASYVNCRRWIPSGRAVIYERPLYRLLDEISSCRPLRTMNR